MWVVDDRGCAHGRNSPSVMCGICGYVGLDDDELLARMSRTLAHRGPDDSGHFQDRDVGLAHRRLCVIDVAGGHQPMSTPDGRMTIVYNGEIYNFRELRDELESDGQRFETQSDTEVLLRLYAVYGVEALQRLNGMFAFCVYDRAERKLFIARDRIGIKPLYYLQVGDRFLFASEAKALYCFDGWARTIDPGAVRDYLGLRYVPGDHTIHRELKRLPAAHWLEVKDGRVRLGRYWAPPLEQDGKRRRDGDYVEELASIFEASVRRRMISDVPVGAYLSGGLDSSTIVAAMSEIVSQPLKTFSVGFDYEHDELREAAATARLLGCDHHELACSAKDIERLPEIVYQLDSPMGDAIILPMFLLSREAKKHVTVILTGEGGDEVFGGYLFHKVMWAGDLYRRAVPRLLRESVVRPAISALPAGVMNLAFQYPAYLGQRGKQKAVDYLSLLEPRELQRAYRHLISLFDSRDTQDFFTADFKEALRRSDDADGYDGGASGSGQAPFLNRLLHLQFEDWLPDNMLARQDKTSMAHGIEARVPFLDHELVEFGMRLPPRLKLRRLTGKYILRKVAARLLPPEVVRRRKMPFYVPVENYFEQPFFQQLMHELLSERSVRARGLFRPQAVAEIIKRLDRREFLLVKQVFSLMVLELWFRIFHDGSAQYVEIGGG